MDEYPSVAEMLAELNPASPVYCVHPHVYADTARRFIDGFPGRVLYAVKACAEPEILKIFIDAGIRDFDCASLKEVSVVSRLSDDVRCYFMVPVRQRGEATVAQSEFGVRHFLVDHASGVERLKTEIDMHRSVVFARMSVHHAAATYDLSVKFGAPPMEIPDLIASIAESGAEPALAFNVGSSVTDPGAYTDAIKEAAELLEFLPTKIRLVDIGGGYPRSYPGFKMPNLVRYFSGIKEAAALLPLPANGEILGEPGRALAGPGLSAVSEVLQRKDERLYINDGMHGIFWELRYGGHKSFPSRCYRNGILLEGETRPFTLYGPTCDSLDELPEKISLPAGIQTGDHLEFGRLGAYSLSGRTDFNGRHSDHIVAITATEETPPGHVRYSN